MRTPVPVKCFSENMLDLSITAYRMLDIPGISDID